MKVSCLQWNSDWEDSQANLDRLEAAIKLATANDFSGSNRPSVVILPEMFNSGFSISPESFAEPLDGPLFETLSSLAKNYHCYLIAGAAIEEGETEQTHKFENSALVFNPAGQLISHYVKQMLFSFAKEQQAYSPGHKSKPFEIGGTPCATFICYDLRFPELFRAVAKSVEVVFVIANWPEERQLHWEALLKARAIENQCFMIGVNRIGTDGNGLSYAGGSMVISPLGEVLVQGSPTDELIQVTITDSLAKETRQSFPFLQDMKSL